jgi:2-polyprenyl-6-methoxyphenol hydroxylase-like FAD-dependent oxidoreductase
MGKEFAADVLICGAGAAGLTLAIDLARRGISFRLIEKMDGPFQGSRGKGLQPRSLEIFEDLGILDRLAAIGRPYPLQREYRTDGGHEDAPFMEHRDPTPDEPYRVPLMVPQFLTEAAMRERLAELGGTPQYGCELTHFTRDDAGVSCRLRTASGEENVRTRYLVGADGGRSFVRQMLDIEFPGNTLGVRAVVADLLLEGLSRDVWHRFSDGERDGQISLCPLAGTDLFQLQAPVPLDSEIDLTAQGLNAMIAERTARTDIAVRAVSWASAFHMNARLADSYRAGRVFLAGDAAHVHPPTGGQGLNTSLQDSYNLGWKLAAVLAGASDTLLDSYEAERRPIAAEVLGLSTNLLEAAKRGAMRGGREVHQLDLGYSGSSLAMEAPARASGVLAGDRAPDAPIRGAAGQPSRLFGLFKGPHWTLLGYHTQRGAVSPRAHLHIHYIGPDREFTDAPGHMADAYGVQPGDWILVRPDGYVGAIVSSDEIVALNSYMASVGLRAP